MSALFWWGGLVRAAIIDSNQTPSPPKSFDVAGGEMHQPAIAA
jgi:hypothetical protein